MSTNTDRNVDLLPNVKNLETIGLPLGCACLDIPSTALNYDMATLEPTDFADREAFSKSRFTQESKNLEELDRIVKKGRELNAVLYTYRSCSNALPQVRAANTDEEKKIAKQIHNKTFEILKPETLKIKELLQYKEEAIKVIKENIELLIKSEQEKKPQSEAIFDHIIFSINELVILDSLKDRKAGLRNDFSRFKRAFSSIRGSGLDPKISDAIAEENHHIQMFMSNPQRAHNLIILDLKDEIQKYKDHELVLTALLDHCGKKIEKKQYVMPEEGHTYYRVVPYLFLLMDSDEKKGGINIFKTPHPRRFKKIFKNFPIIPLYGDMRVEVMMVLQHCHHWEPDMESEWEANNKKGKLDQVYELKYHRERIRNDYRSRLAEFTTLLNEVKVYQELSKTITPEMLEKTFKLILECLKGLSNWSAQVIEQSAYKFANPLDTERLLELIKEKGIGDNTLHKGNEYERVVSYNYSDEELHVLIDVVGMIKGLGGLMMKYELLFVPLIRRYIHDEFQDFLQQELARPLRKAHKRKRQETKDVMLQMREIGADWLTLDSKNDYETKKKDLVVFNRDYPRRATAPTLTQIVLVRRMVRWIYSPRADGMKGGLFGKDKDLKKEWIHKWERFDNVSFFYKYLLSYHQTLRILTDMSHLWYREFYLEMTQCVQFPIRMSMPWIMTDYLIRTPSMKENMFFPMDIYNDAGSRALVALKQQFLYDEIEAECNLSFDQLIFHLAIDVFKFYKTVAAAGLIDQEYRQQFQRIKPHAGRMANSRYVALCSQRHINLLGRTVDLKLLITEHVNVYMRDNLNFIIQKFTSKSLCSIVDFQMLLANARYAHNLLLTHLSLDPWNDLWKECNNDVTISHFRGKVVLHIFSELVSDVMCNFTFNVGTERFVRSKYEFTESEQREKPPRGVAPHFWHGIGFNQCFDKHSALYKNYFGMKHIEVIVDLLGQAELPLLIREVRNHLEDKIIYQFAPYVTVLTRAIPPGMKLPPLQYGVIGGHGLFDLKLGNAIASYAELRSGAFQYLREIGNTLIFLQLLEKVLNNRRDFVFNFVSFFSGMKAHPATPENADNAQAPETPFINGPKCQPFLSVISHTLQKAQEFGMVDSEHVQNVMRSATNAAEVHCYEGEQQKSLFTSVLMHLRQSINKNVRQEWLGNLPVEGQIIEVENPGDFARLFSAVLFIFCQAPTKVQLPFEEQMIEVDDLEAFGVGFLWGGCTILHLLGLTDTFMMLDFSYHVLKLDLLGPLQKAEPDTGKKKKKKDADSPGYPKIVTFLRNASWAKKMNERIFMSLESYMPREESKFDPINPPSVHDVEDQGLFPIRQGTQRLGSKKSISRTMGSPLMSDAAAPPSPAPPSAAPPSTPPPASSPGLDPTATFGAPPPRPPDQY